MVAGVLVGVLPLWPALFFLWSPGLFCASRAVPGRTYDLWLLTTLLSILLFANYLIERRDYSRRWHDVEDIQKWRFANGMSGALAIVVGIFLLRAWIPQTPSYAMNLLLHWTMFAWFTWCAFPFPPTI